MLSLFLTYGAHTKKVAKENNAILVNRIIEKIDQKRRGYTKVLNAANHFISNNMLIVVYLQKHAEDMYFGIVYKPLKNDAK